MGININPMAFGKTWGMSKARRELAKYIEPLGKQRITFVVTSDLPITACLPAQKVAQWKENASKPLYHRFSEIMSDQDAISILPKTMLEVIIEQGTQGRKWCQDNIRLIRKYFFGQEVSDGNGQDGQADTGEFVTAGRGPSVQHQDPGRPAEFE